MFAARAQALPRMLSLFVMVACGCGSGSSARRGDAGAGSRDAAEASDSGRASDAAARGQACPVEGYTPCAGDLAGSWTWAGLCPEAPDDAPCESPFDAEPACGGAGNEARCQLLAEGEVTFSGSQVRIVRSATVEARYTFSAECLAAVRPDGADAAARCAELSRPPRLTCTFADETCACVGQSSPETTDETVPFTVDGSAISLGGELQATYCVDGERLTLDFEPHPASWRYWVLER